MRRDLGQPALMLFLRIVGAGLASAGWAELHHPLQCQGLSSTTLERPYFEYGPAVSKGRYEAGLFFKAPSSPINPPPGLSLT